MNYSYCPYPIKKIVYMHAYILYINLNDLFIILETASNKKLYTNIQIIIVQNSGLRKNCN